MLKWTTQVVAEHLHIKYVLIDLERTRKAQNKPTKRPTSTTTTIIKDDDNGIKWRIKRRTILVYQQLYQLTSLPLFLCLSSFFNSLTHAFPYLSVDNYYCSNVYLCVSWILQFLYRSERQLQISKICGYCIVLYLVLELACLILASLELNWIG